MPSEDLLGGGFEVCCEVVVLDEENGELSHDSQPDEEPVLDEANDFGVCVGAISADVQFALVFFVASIVEDDSEANGVSCGRLFFSHASRVL